MKKSFSQFAVLDAVFSPIYRLSSTIYRFLLKASAAADPLGGQHSTLGPIFAALRILIGGLFIFSGALKLTDLISFHDAVEAFNIIPMQYSNMATVLIPSAEIVCGIALATGIFRKGAGLLLFCMLVIFTVAIGVNLYRGESFNCNCFGNLQLFGRISIGKLLFNIFLAGVMSLILFKEGNYKSIANELGILGSFILAIALMVNIPFGNRNLVHSLNSLHIKKADFAQALDKMQTQNGILLDARAKIRYDEEHAPGALSLPVGEFQEYYPLYRDSLNGKAIFIYCDGSDCSASQRLAFKLVQRGMNDIYTINESLAEWKSKKQKM